MTADEQGFDPDLNYTQEDNPFWDGTNGAHPAWWRGEDNGCRVLVKLVNQWLDDPIEKLERGSHQQDIQALKERIIELRKNTDQPS